MLTGCPFDGEIREKNGALQSSKRKGGIGVQSVRRIAEKTGGASTFTYLNGVFMAKVMLHGGKNDPAKSKPKAIDMALRLYHASPLFRIQKSS